jgi:Fe-S-cluster containining protein
MLDRLWYREGLRFTCTACGDCCSGAPGYVWVTKQEIEDLAVAMGYGDVAEFEEQCVRMVGTRRSLRERANFDCVLLDPDTRKCRAYDARPRQCRNWPFWDSNVDTPESWQRTCEVCPGSGRGRLYSLTEIETQRRVVRV